MTRNGPKRPDEGTGLTARSGIQKRENKDEEMRDIILRE